MQSTVKIIGTSHIAKSSVRKIKKTFEEFQPDIVAVELDKRRLQALQERAAGGKGTYVPLSTIRKVGITGYIFLIVGAFVQKRLGGIVKMEPGIDMLTAVKLSKGKQLFLVDQDVLVTMRHLSKAFTWKEKFRVVWDILSAPFTKLNIKLKLDDVPDKKTIEVMMGIMKKRYPSIYHVLVIERNIVMAARIDSIVRRNPARKVLLVVGAGHEDDLRQRLLRTKIAALE